MRPEDSPFTPGQPVPIEFFVGRVSEIERVRALVRAASIGKFRVGFISGERGIGKSSLVSFVRHLTEREDNVVGAHVFLGGVNTLTEMVRRTFDRVLKDSVEKPWHKKIRELFGKYVKQVGLFGISVELEIPEADLASLVHGFAPHLRKLLAGLRNERQAMLIILDDINRLLKKSFWREKSGKTPMISRVNFSIHGFFNTLLTDWPARLNSRTGSRVRLTKSLPTATAFPFASLSLDWTNAGSN